MAESTRRVVRIFNGHYTMENTTTGEHRTFMIRTQAAHKKFAPGSRIISLLTGPDNIHDYHDFGFVSDEGIHVWKRYRGEPGEKSAYEWYATMLWDIATRGRESNFFKAGYRLMIEARCVKCGRLLTEPESLKTGIGPRCAGRM